MNDYLRFRDRFRELLEEDRMYSIEQLDLSLLQGHSQFWCHGESAIVTEMVEYEGGDRIGQVEWAVGDLDEILSDLMPRAEAYLWAQGAKRIMFEGRPGWKRVLRQHGFRDYSVTLVKDAA